MVRETMEQELARAGWEVDDGFSGHLLIGNADDDLSILIPWSNEGEAAPQYELYDAQRNIVCRMIGVVPTPLQARMLLEEHGESAFGDVDEEWATPTNNH
jgi:hypothetical protein